MKVRYKITFAFVLISVIMLAILFAVTYFSTISQQQKDFSKRLYNRALTVSYLYQKMHPGGYDLLSRVDSSTINLMGAETINIFDETNRQVYRFSHKNEDTVAVPRDFIEKTKQEGNASMVLDGKQLFALYRPADNPVVVVVTAVDISGKNNLRELLQNQVKTFIAGILLSFLAGWYFSKRILVPLQKLSGTVKEISATNIEKRLDKGAAKDEWYELTDTFNGLLSRLQESFEVQGRFIANAAHELSTPLTSIRSQIDVVLAKDRDKEAYRSVLEHVSFEVEHLGSLTHQLLNIARTARGGAIQTELVRVDELLMEMPGIIQKNSPEYTVELFFDELPENELRCMVNGNYELLLSALRNLTENGCKYASDDHVKISLSFVAGTIVIFFSNLSDTIDAAEVGELFQPFQRGSNAAGIKGYGLGLSLTKRIILLHKGEIKVEMTGLSTVVVTVILPSAAPEF